MAERESRPEEFWKKFLEDWLQSGEGVRAFCEKRGVASSTFYGWREKFGQLKPRKTPPVRRKTSLVPVQVVSGPSASSARSTVEWVLRSGRVVRIYSDLDADGLVKLVTALEKAAC